MIVGSLYRPPNTTEKNLCEHINETISKIQVEMGNKPIILGMDHNLDLLKSNIHKQTQKFLDVVMNNGLLPLITRPTRITNRTVMLIDNIFISGILQQKFDSTIIIHDIRTLPDNCANETN